MPRPQFHNHPDGLHPNPFSHDWQDRNRPHDRLPRLEPGDILIRGGMVTYDVCIVEATIREASANRLRPLSTHDYLLDALNAAVHACAGDRNLYIRNMAKVHADDIPF